MFASGSFLDIPKCDQILIHLIIRNSSIIVGHTNGSIKFAVPTATALAPIEEFNYIFSCFNTTHSDNGMLTAWLTSCTMRIATGLIAGPDNPPVRFAKIGLAVLNLDAYQAMY